MAPAISDDEISETESERSLRDPYEAYHDFESEHYRLRETQRRVNIILRDGHDTHGKGMTVELPYLNSFTNVFDHFKSRSCTNCRYHEEMRFKTHSQTVSVSDTPKKLDLIHGSTTEITVWSSVPGLQCDKCLHKGYPSTRDIDRTMYLRTALLPVGRSGGAGYKQKTITLTVQDQIGFKTSVKMLNTTPFNYLMDQYATSAYRDRDLCRFLCDGERLDGADTPKKMDLIDGDGIEVFFEQTGGRLGLERSSALFSAMLGR